jgi:hypothetical protein
MMKIGRRGIVLAADKLVEACLLFSISTEHQHNVCQGEIGPDWPKIVPRIRRRMSVACESYKLILVDPLKNPGCRGCPGCGTLREGLGSMDERNCR